MVLVRVIVTPNTGTKVDFGTSFGEKMSISLNRQKPIKAEDLAYYSLYVKTLNQIYEDYANDDKEEKYFKIVRRGEEKTDENRMHSLTKVAKALFIIEKDSPGETKNTSNDTVLKLKNNQLDASIFAFAKDKNEDSLKEEMEKKYQESYKYVNWVIACEKAYTESIDKFVPSGDKKDLANNTKVFLRNGNWYFVAYLLKDIIYDMESENHPAKICTNETMGVLIPAFKKIVEKYFIDNPNEDVAPSSFKKNDLYREFIEYISKIKDNDGSKYGEYWIARNEIIKALFKLSK